MPLWNLLTPAQLILGSTFSQLKFVAVTGGTAGNSVRVRIVVAGAGTSLSVSVSSSDITINSATNGSSVATSTADAVVAAVIASGPAAALVTASTGHLGAGTGVVAAVGFTNLAGGKAATSPKWVDSYISDDGFRSSDTGELLVSESVAIALATPVFTTKLLTPPGTHFHTGDTIFCALEASAPLYQLYTNLGDGGGNTIAISSDYKPTTVKVNLLNPGVISSPLSAKANYINFNNQLIININLATNGSGTITSTVAAINTYCAANNIPFVMAGSGVTTAQVLSGPWTRTEPTATVPITINGVSRTLSLKSKLGSDQPTLAQNSGFSSVLDVPSQAGLLLGYTLVGGDSATPGQVQIGTGAVADTLASGSGNSEVTFTANAAGLPANHINVVLNAPISANVGALSSGWNAGTFTITYNLKTTGGTQATRTFGTSNAALTFTAVAIGASGNSVTVTLAQSGNQALSIGVIGNAITVNLQSSSGTGISTATEVANFLTSDVSAGAVAARALVTCTAGGTGASAVVAATVLSLATGTNAHAISLVSELITFSATDPNTASAAITLTTTGNGTGIVAGAASAPLATGADSTATITFGNGNWVDSTNTGFSTTITPPGTSLIAVN